MGNSFPLLILITHIFHKLVITQAHSFRKLTDTLKEAMTRVEIFSSVNLHVLYSWN